MLQLLSNLLPKEEKFYHMLEAMVRHAHTSVAELTTLVHSEDTAQQQAAAEKIAEAKAEAKAVFNQLNLEVCRTFVTPFDREDLQEFAATLYHIPKLINKTQDRLLANELSPKDDDFFKLVDIISRQALLLDEVMAMLKKTPNLNTMNAKVGEIHELEDKGDQLLGEFITQLFGSKTFTPRMILRKDVYEMLEDITDFYRDCANVALRIVLKHS